MMEYLGLASSSTISGEAVCRYWCDCCKIESQYVDSSSLYLKYPSWTAVPTYSTSTTFWKSPGFATASGGVTFTYEPDED